MSTTNPTPKSARWPVQSLNHPINLSTLLPQLAPSPRALPPQNNLALCCLPTKSRDRNTKRLSPFKTLLLPLKRHTMASQSIKSRGANSIRLRLNTLRMERRTRASQPPSRYSNIRSSRRTIPPMAIPVAMRPRSPCMLFSRRPARWTAQLVAAAR